ncbi:MAG: Crp/Fnr family transcriptional regulator [Saprospiraceae bacterium]|uniref:Crp/Fnr family transcriptional regulator n=1 Tax=Candidatus Opimibacter skivensis TaxID=2982028 RepID=A0A9D7XLB2_9BACT|nr:Crp/Fnr family transcriptional regulator [Candidatus Opimibacter skivensis]
MDVVYTKSLYKMTSNSTLFHSLLNKEAYASGQIKSFPAGTVILDMNAYIRSVPIVLSGSIKVIRTDEEGKEILLYYIKPGESCIMSFLAGIHNDTSKIKAIIEEDAEILLIPVNKASEWIKEFPEWSDFIFSLYQKRFEELLEVVNAVAFQKIDARLLHLLTQKSSLFHSKEIMVTHQQLADELGITREAASRVLKQMENEGHISLSRNKIILL